MKNKDTRISRRLFDELLDLQRRSFKHMVGRVLTIVDGVTVDPTQRKAIKNLVEEELYRFSSQQDGNIRRYMEYLAVVLKEECDWVIKVEASSSGEKYNPLTD